LKVGVGKPNGNDNEISKERIKHQSHVQIMVKWAASKQATSVL
jgi:hypothetical protein